MRPRPKFFVVWLLLSCSGLALRAGELETHELASKFVGRTVKLNVLLPNGYQEGDTHYPVVYLLHGFGGDYTEWARVGVVERAAGLPVIIAMPEGDKSFYINLHEDSENRWEDYIVQEVIPFVDGAYRTRAERDGRGVSGLSMGGYGAFMLGLRHPDLFASVASHSGALGVLELEEEDEFGERVHEVFGPEDSDTREEYDLYDLLEGRARDRNLPHVYLDCGSRDFVLEWNRDFVAELAEFGVEYEYRELSGEHDFEYWRAHVRYSLERQLEAFARPEGPRQPEGERPDGVVGVWDMVATTPDDEEVEIVLSMERDGDELGGTLESERGKNEFDEISYEDDVLRIKVPFRDGAWVVLEGRLDEGGLVGDWEIQDKDGKQFLRGEWTAVRRGGQPEREVPEREEDSIAGVWEVLATVPGEEPKEYLWTIESEGDGYVGRAQGDDGTVAFSEIEFEDDRLEIEVPLGEGGTVYLVGRRVDGRLVGEWRLEDEGGDEVAEGEWRAGRQGRVSGGTDPVAKDSGGIVGVWQFEATLPDGESHAARLFIERRGNRYAGRSESEHGDAKFESIRYDDEKLEIEIELPGGEIVVLLKARLDGDRLEGEWVVEDDVGVEVAKGSWQATREVGSDDDTATVVSDLAGTWEVVAVLPDGSERNSKTILARDGERYSGRSESEDGTVEFDKVSFAGGGLEIEFKLEIEGRETPFSIRAKLEDGRLEGRWMVHSPDGEELASGEWRAARGKSRRF